MLTAIVSPGVLFVMLVIVLVGTGIMTSVVRHKYECTPEREKELEEAGVQETGQKASGDDRTVTPQGKSAADVDGQERDTDINGFRYHNDRKGGT